MNRTGLVLGAALCAGAISSVQAADLPAGVPNGVAPTYYPVAPFWSGAYVGVNLGVGWDNAAWANSFDGVGDRARPWGVVGGGQVGFNYQIYSWVIGVEGTASGADLIGNSQDGGGFIYGIKDDWTATVTGRLGYDYNQRLFYVKGGAAFADSRETVTDPAGVSATTATAGRFGYAFGAGVEVPLSRTWSWRVEYDFMYFPIHSLNIALPEGPIATGSSLQIQTFTIGVNYRF
jgi:outer membrane immunogenic protein